MALPSKPRGDYERGSRAIVSRAFELALLMAQHEGDGWPRSPGEVRHFQLHSATVELHFRDGAREHTYLTYDGPWGSWLGDVDAAGNLVHIAYQARGAAAEP
jgi:hypothetical protein